MTETKYNTLINTLLILKERGFTSSFKIEKDKMECFKSGENHAPKICLLLSLSVLIVRPTQVIGLSYFRLNVRTGTEEQLYRLMIFMLAPS